MKIRDLLYKVEPLYRSNDGILIPNAIKFDLESGEVRDLYRNVFETLKDFYEQKKFYVKQAMTIDKPTKWQSNPPLHIGVHQIWKNASRTQKKGKIVVTVKEDTRRNFKKRVGYQSLEKNVDYPASRLFGGGRDLYDTISVGSEPALFLFVNSFSPYYKPFQESEEYKQLRCEEETLALAYFFGERNKGKASVFFKSDLERRIK